MRPRLKALTLEGSTANVDETKSVSIFAIVGEEQGEGGGEDEEVV